MNLLNRSFIRNTLVAVLLFCGPDVQAQSPNFIAKNIVKRGYTRLFTYDPTNSGTVAVSYVNKFSRLSARLVQPHTVERTACGYYFEGLRGLPLSTATYSIDISTDTNVSSKADLILIGIDHAGNSKLHEALGINYDSKFLSAPGWNTYNYSATTFSPPIGADETFGSFTISLLGGNSTMPDHADHWLSRPVINGINIRELINDTVVVTDGRLVGF
ncbi:MAG: hypothetical protein JST89_12240 [Cyanobacteria bacterium SZAS-4]|nr:hypothetical protein [Cyanobacteria bacterium SZAS-4]